MVTAAAAMKVSAARKQSTPSSPVGTSGCMLPFLAAVCALREPPLPLLPPLLPLLAPLLAPKANQK